MHRAAQEYAERRIPSFPCKHAPDKAPLTRHGFKDATTDPRKINMFWNANPGASIAVPTGKRSGFFVVDVDSVEALEELEELPPTYAVRTPKGGLHFYFRHADGITNSPGSLPKGIDIRGEGGYVLVPPSPGYEAVAEEPTAQAPAWLLERIKGRSPNGGTGTGGSSRPEIPEGEPIPEGSRNTTLFFAALALKDEGKSRKEIADRLLAINEERCVTPLGTEEVLKIANSAARYPIRGKKTPPEVLEQVEALERAWWATAWKGVGGKGERDVLKVLLELARRYGILAVDGVRVTVSVRALALAAAAHFVTVASVLKRLRAAGWLRRDDAHREGNDAGALVLLNRTARQGANTQASFRVDAKSVSGSSRLPSTGCFRWRGWVGKGRAGALYALEGFGPQTAEELAERLGWSRARDLLRRYLEPLAALGLVEDRGGVWALPGDYRERVEEVRSMPYTTTRRRKERGPTSEGRVVTYVVETERTASEVEREQEDRERYEEDRRRFREALRRRRLRSYQDPSNAPEEREEDQLLPEGADGWIEDLERVEDDHPPEDEHRHPPGCQCLPCAYEDLVRAGEGVYPPSSVNPAYTSAQPLPYPRPRVEPCGG